MWIPPETWYKTTTHHTSLVYFSPKLLLVQLSNWMDLLHVCELTYLYLLHLY